MEELVNAIGVLLAGICLLGGICFFLLNEGSGLLTKEMGLLVIVYSLALGRGLLCCGEEIL